MSGGSAGAARSDSSVSKKYVEPCVICLEPITERAITPCNHHFDFLCLVSWLQEHNSCPLCKAQVARVEYDWRSPDDYLTYIVPQSPPPTETPTPAPSRSYPQYHGRRQHPYIPRRPPRPGPVNVDPDVALLRRRHVYREKLFSLHVGSNRLSKFKDFTQHDFATSDELQARARKWIRRELQVFDFLSADAPASSGRPQRRAENAEFLLLYIISILKTVDIKGSSGKAVDLLGSYLGEENARLFLHELEAFLRSPFVNLEDFDRHVQYATPMPKHLRQYSRHWYDWSQRAVLTAHLRVERGSP